MVWIWNRIWSVFSNRHWIWVRIQQNQNAWITIRIQWIWIRNTEQKLSLMNIKILLLLTVGLGCWEWAEGAAEWGPEAGVAGLAAPRDARGLQDTAPQHLTSLHTRERETSEHENGTKTFTGRYRNLCRGSQRIDAIPDPDLAPDPTIKIGKS